MDEQDSFFEQQKTLNNLYFDQDCNEFLQGDIVQQVLHKLREIYLSTVPKEQVQPENIHQNTKYSDDEGDSKKEDIPVYRWLRVQQTESLHERAVVYPEKNSKKLKF